MSRVPGSSLTFEPAGPGARGAGAARPRLRTRGFWAVLETTGTLAAVAVLACAAWLEPDPSGAGTHTQLGLPPCGYLVTFGKPCLSCGLTTAFASMIRGDVAGAYHANPAGIPLFLVTAAAPFWLIHAFVTGRDPTRFVRHRVGGWILPALVGLLVLAWMRQVST